MKFLINLFLGFFKEILACEVGALTYAQVESLTHDLIKDKMTDGVFLSDAFLNRVREKQELEDGGNVIRCPLYSVDETGTVGGFFSPRDALSLNEYDGITNSSHDWKYVEESCVIYNADIAKNAGRLGVLKLVKEKVMQSEAALKERLKKGILSDGTASTGELTTKQFVGMQAFIAASGTYGGIAVADLASWVSVDASNSGTPRALTKAILDLSYDNTNEEGKGGATLGLSNKAVFSKIKGLLTGQQRTTRESTLSGQGHKGTSIVYNGIDYLIENNMPAETIFHLDERHAKLHVQKDNNMRVQKISDLETADAQLHRVFLYASYVASQRKYHGKIGDITE